MPRDLNLHQIDHGGVVMICVDIDVAKRKHDRVNISSKGKASAKVFTISHTMEGTSPF
jgi:hypothetical protein